MEQYELIHRLLSIAKLHRVLSGKRLAKMNPYAGQWMPVIRYVLEHDGCTQAELAAFLRVTPASVALSTKRMKKAGFLLKEADENNLRRNMLHVTEAGRQLAMDCKDAFEALEHEAFQGFDAAELEQLGAYLDRVAVNLGGGRRLNFGEILDLQKQSESEEQGDTI